jgi:MFS family permease
MNVVDVLMIAACFIVWLIAFVLFQIYYTPWYIILVSVIVLLCYLFMVYFIPLKKNYDTTISNAKQEYLDNKDKIDEVYVTQLKTIWANDVSARNRYFILMFAVFCYIPVLYYVFYLLYHDPKQQTMVDRFMNWMTLPVTLGLISAMSLLMGIIWLFYTFGFTYLLLYVLVPIVFLGGFLWAAIFYQHWVKPSTAAGIIAFIGMISMLIAASLSGGWSNILYVLAGLMLFVVFAVILSAVIIFLLVQ